MPIGVWSENPNQGWSTHDVVLGLGDMVVSRCRPACMRSFPPQTSMIAAMRGYLASRLGRPCLPAGCCHHSTEYSVRLSTSIDLSSQVPTYDVQVYLGTYPAPLGEAQ